MAGWDHFVRLSFREGKTLLTAASQEQTAPLLPQLHSRPPPSRGPSPCSPLAPSSGWGVEPEALRRISAAKQREATTRQPGTPAPDSWAVAERNGLRRRLPLPTTPQALSASGTAPAGVGMAPPALPRPTRERNLPHETVRIRALNGFPPPLAGIGGSGSRAMPSQRRTPNREKLLPAPPAPVSNPTDVLPPLRSPPLSPHARRNGWLLPCASAVAPRGAAQPSSPPVPPCGRCARPSASGGAGAVPLPRER